MVKYKNCPACSAEAPVTASRCKECFHDFTAKKRSFAPVFLMGTMAVMMLVAAAVFFAAARAPTDKMVLVDEGTQSIIITTQYTTGPSTDRIAFADVVKLEHVAEHGEYSIVAVTADDRTLIERSKSQPLYKKAENYGTMMNKPVERTGADETAKAPTSAASSSTH